MLVLSDSSTKNQLLLASGAQRVVLSDSDRHTQSWREFVSDWIKDTSAGWMVANTEIWTCVLSLKEGLFTHKHLPQHLLSNQWVDFEPILTRYLLTTVYTYLRIYRNTMSCSMIIWISPFILTVRILQVLQLTSWFHNIEILILLHQIINKWKPAIKVRVK